MKNRFIQIPFRKGHSGGVAEIDDIDKHIKDKIIDILFTIPGERVNLPEYGCRIRDLVFEGNSEVLEAATKFNVYHSLRCWMGEEVEIEDVTVFNEEETLFIQIFYRRLDSRIPSRLEVAYKL